MHALYDTTTGRILGFMLCPDSTINLQIQHLPAGQGLIEYTGEIAGSTHYYDLINTIRPRPIIEAEPNRLVVLANSPDSIIIQNLPIPCTIKSDGQTYEMTDPDDSTFEFTIGTQGIYKIEVEVWPYITKSWEIEAV